MTPNPFIMLQMFKDQSKRNYGSQSFTPQKVPFLQWKEGYIVKSNGGEQFTLTKIISTDGALHHENCSVTLVNSAGETREIKAGSLRSGYEFVSYGDVPPPKENGFANGREDVQPLVVNIAGIREYYPRKSGEGTRILMMDKTAYIVADPLQNIFSMVAQAGGYLAGGTIGEVNNNNGSDEAQG